MDWTADGIVNFKEFGIFAGAWLSTDPNNPLCDPNNPDYVSDPNDPDYITEGDKQRYSSRCDIDDDLAVDMGDLDLFSDEWLWMACWKQSQMDSSIMMMAMGMGGGESAMMSVPLPATLSMDSTVIAVAEPKSAFPSESDLARFVNGVNEIIGFVDRAIKEDHPNSEALYEMKAALEAILLELRDDVALK